MAGVEGFLVSHVTEILKRLIIVVVQEIRFASGVKEELENLQTTLNMILSVMITDAEMKQQNDASARLWMKDLKAVAYEADDILDELSYEIKHHHEIRRRPTNKVRNLFLSCASCSSKPTKLSTMFCINMGHKIKDIDKKISEFTSRRRDMLAGGIGSSSSHTMTTNIVPGISMNRKPCSSCVGDPKIYGRENDKSNIINMLLEENPCNSTTTNQYEQISVIPIVGMGGLGKTTLAQLVYIDNSVKDYFDIKMWVLVTQTFDVKRILVDITESITGCKYDQDVSNFDVVVNRLQGHLRRKKFLLVLDDVWNLNQEEWDKLKNPLKVGDIKSKIIITTRSNTVASIVVGSTFPTYQLQRLQVSECRSILTQRAFGSSGGAIEPSNLVTIRKELNKLSYEHLPSHLKQCFSYCSIFPKSREIEIETLIQLWIAEGFLLQSDGRNGTLSLEEIGHVYFNKLVDNSLFQEVYVHDDTLMFKMHDLVHDLAQAASGNEESLIVAERAHNVEYISNTRRLQLVNLDEEMLAIASNRLNGAKELRSFFLKETRCVKYIETIINNNQRLRVLDLSETGLEELPSSIGNLKHLRYLDLSHTNIKTLPESITKLYHLQTLKLHATKLARLPEGLNKLTELRNLQFSR